MRVPIDRISKYANYGSLHLENLMYIDNEHMVFLADMSDDQIKRFARDYFSDDNTYENMTPEDIYLDLQEVFVVVYIDDYFDKNRSQNCYLFPASEIGFDFDIEILRNIVSDEE